MQKNMGLADRLVRMFVAIGIGVLIALNLVGGITALLLWVLALALLFGSLFQFCPLYVPFGIKTCTVINPVEVAQTQMFDTDGDAPPRPDKGASS